MVEKRRKRSGGGRGVEDEERWYTRGGIRGRADQIQERRYNDSRDR